MPKTSSVSKTHSKYYTTLFPDDIMIEVFGNVQPTPSERANYFKNLWYEWSAHEIVMPKRTGLERVLHEKLEPHMKALFEWQVRAEMKQDSTMDNNNDVTSNKRYMKKVLVLRFKSTELCALGKILLS